MDKFDTFVRWLYTGKMAGQEEVEEIKSKLREEDKLQYAAVDMTDEQAKQFGDTMSGSF